MSGDRRWRRHSDRSFGPLTGPLELRFAIPLPLFRVSESPRFLEVSEL